MTLLQEIQAACSAEQIAEGNFHVIAAAVNAAREAAQAKVVRSRLISERGILEGYVQGPVAADAVLAKLEAFADAGQPLSRLVKRSLKFLADPAGLDVGSPATRAMLDQLAAGGVITADEAANLKALAESVAPAVTWQECATAVEQGA